MVWLGSSRYTALNPSSNIWYGTLSGYKALTAKDSNTIYICRYLNLIPSAIFIGTLQIYPTDIDYLDYDIAVSDVTLSGSNAYETGVDWCSSNFEIQLKLRISPTYSDIQTIFGDKANSNLFNLFLNNGNIVAYWNGRDVIIDSITTSVYRIVKSGSTVNFYRDNTLLVTKTMSEVQSSNLVLFGLGNKSYGYRDNINYFLFKFT